ncbi:MAG: HigA family addiction module antitoxin [Nitrospinota bacterium]
MEVEMEDKKRPYRPIQPGEILKEELDARGWTLGDFAEITGKPLQAINQIIACKKAITPETAILFSKALGTSPEFWLNLEDSYRKDKV